MHGQVFIGRHVGNREVVGYDEHHAVAVDKRDGGLATVAQRHLFAILEVVLHVEVLRAENLKAALIERVVEGAAHRHRIPGIATFHPPLQSHLLGLQAEGFLLGGILHLEQQPVFL